MTVSRSEGTPISAKYEIDDGTFQLSVYTMRGDRFSEVIVDYNVGTIAKVDPITDGGDLAAAKNHPATTMICAGSAMLTKKRSSPRS